MLASYCSVNLVDKKSYYSDIFYLYRKHESLLSIFENLRGLRPIVCSTGFVTSYHIKVILKNMSSIYIIKLIMADSIFKI